MNRIIAIIALVFFLSQFSMGQPYFNKSYDLNTGYDIGKSIFSEVDGYILVNYAQPMGKAGIWISKVSLDGDNLIWEIVHGDSVASYFVGSPGACERLADGNFLVAGNIQTGSSSTNEAMLLKFNAQGDTLWKRFYGGADSDIFYDVVELQEYEYIAVGSTRSLGDPNSDYFFVKTDSSGNELWKKSFGDGQFESAWFIVHSGDGNLFVSGGKRDPLTQAFDPPLVKIDTAANKIWERTYGTLGDDCYGEVISSSDGGFIYSGCLDTIINNSLDYDYPPFVSKLDADGEILWRKFFNDTALSAIYNIRELDNGDLVAIGEKQQPGSFFSGGWMFKLNESGDIQWERIYSHLAVPASEQVPCWFNSMDFLTNGDIVVTGTTFESPGGGVNQNQNVWLMRLDSNGCLGNDCGLLSTGIVPVPAQPVGEVLVFPNPLSSSSLVTIKSTTQAGEQASFTLYDLAGRQMFQNSFQLNEYGYHEFLLSKGNLPAGPYFYEVLTNEEVIGRGKILFQ